MSRLAPIVATVVVVAAFGSALAELTPGEVDAALKHVLRADEALRSGDVEKAEQLYEKALRNIDSLPEAQIGLGHIAMREARFEKALYHYQSAREGYGELTEQLLQFRSRRYTNAQQQIVSTQDTILQLQNPATSRGDARYQVSKLENRMAMLQGVRAPTGDHDQEAPGEIYFFIGNAFYRLNRLEQAVEAWETCRELAPEFGPNHNNLALAYWIQGRPLQARRSLQRAERSRFPVDPAFKAKVDAAVPDSTAGGSPSG